MTVTVNCSFCGAELKRRPSEVKKRSNHFCNNQCRGNWLKGQKPWNYKGKIATNCDICGKEFYRLESKIGENKFCSRECYLESKRRHTGELHPLYDRIEVGCSTCGKKYNIIPYKYNRSENHFCSLECKYNWVKEGQARQGYKICTKCGSEIEATSEYFYRDKQTRDGLSPQCKECRDAEIRVIYPYGEAKRKEYREKNKKRLREYAKKYREENKEKIRAYYIENRDKHKAAKAIYYQNNKDKYREYSKKYYATDKGKRLRKICLHRRRAKQKELLYDFEPRQWESAKKYFNYRCAYCGKSEEEHFKQFGESLHQEHFIPVAKGGNHTKDNIIPACRNCNGGKRDKDFFEWYPEQEFYNKDMEKKVLNYIRKQKSCNSEQNINPAIEVVVK